MKRFTALLVSIALCISILPWQAFAAGDTPSTGAPNHVIGDLQVYSELDPPQQAISLFSTFNAQAYSATYFGDQLGEVARGMYDAADKTLSANTDWNSFTDIAEVPFPVENGAMPDEATINAAYEQLQLGLLAWKYDNLDESAWTTSEYGVAYGYDENEDGTIASFSFYGLWFSSEYYTADLTTQRDAKVSQIAAAAATADTRVEKLRQIHNAICLEGDYDYDALSMSSDTERFYYAHSSLGLLLTELGVCESYAKAFKLVCDAVGLPCIVVISATHMWNYVQMEDGVWYMVDCTWDDNGGTDYDYDNFLCSNIQSSADSAHIEESFTYPVTSTTRHPESGGNDSGIGGGTGEDTIQPGDYITDGQLLALVLTENTCEIVGFYEEATDTAGPLEIPAYMGDFAVVSIGDRAFYANSDITSLTLPETVQSVGADAFAQCSALTQVTLNEGLLLLEDEAFYSCSALTGTLTIPSSVTSIGRYAFRSAAITGLVLGSGLQVIGEGAFELCTSLAGTLTLPQGLATISDSAFSNCQQLTGSLTIPDSVTTLGSYAFNLCKGLTGLQLGAGLDKVSQFTFNACSGLTGTLTIPKNITAIERNAFNGCSGFTALDLGSVETIGQNAFGGCSGMQGVLTFPTSLKTVGNTAFQNCSGFTGLDLGSVETLGNNVFQLCSGITGSLTIPASLTGWGSSVFAGLNITGLTFAEGVAALGEYAFSNCRKLLALQIPSTVATIPVSCFDGCSGLTSLTIAEGPTAIADAAFRGLYNLQGVLTIPASVKTIGDYAFHGLNSSGTTGNVTGLVLQEGLEAIGDYAFYCALRLDELTIPGSCKTIGAHAFGSLSATRITIGRGVESIGSSAFLLYDDLNQTVTLPRSLTNIAADAFANSTDAVIWYVAQNSDGETYVRDTIGAVYGETYFYTDEALPTPPTADLNGDDAVTILDALLLANWLSGSTELTALQQTAADTNGDNAVTVIDLTRILNYVTGTLTDWNV